MGFTLQGFGPFLHWLTLGALDLRLPAGTRSSAAVFTGNVQLADVIRADARDKLDELPVLHL